MAQLTAAEMISRILQGTGSVCDYALGVVDRSSGAFCDEETDQLDYKLQLDLDDDGSVAELARDVLAFSNSRGGLLLYGVTDHKQVVGFKKLDPRVARDRLGPYMGTMVEYEVSVCMIHVGGRELVLPYILVPRCVRAYPNLLRRDILLRGGFGRKVKYVAGSLFYRDGDQTLVEPAGGDIDIRAHELGFTGARPRTQSSFLLSEDRPGVRLYAHINDRFVGRNTDVAEILAKYEDSRGRGVSIGGLGGMGKTELAIEVVDRAYKSGRFRSIYSGSAKKLVMGALGPQVSDACFSDFPGFLRDLGGWLGLDFNSSTTLEELKAQCLAEIRSRKKVLLFVDNLETIEDGRLFQFLDHEIPDNVWLLTTSRVHKVKNYIYQKSLEAMSPSDAAHLLRHELKRQGLADYASMAISTLEQRAILLQRHPLMIRWYAWNCRKRAGSWNTAPKSVSRAEVEDFCVANTLGHLSFSAQKVLAAIAATHDQIELTISCIEQVSGIGETELEIALDDLECAGLISVVVDDRTGLTTYNTVTLANEPGRELARKHDWENSFSRGLRQYLAGNVRTPVADPLMRYLLQFDPSSIKTLTPEEINELKARIEKCIDRNTAYRVPLLALAAECERHSNHIITSDDLYKEAADQILAGPRPIDYRSSKILLEAATVAKFRSQTDAQIRRAIGYLEAISDTDFAPLRITGMLVEFHAKIGDQQGYKKYLGGVTTLREENKGRFSMNQLQGLDEALSRAAAMMNNRGMAAAT